MKHIFCLLVLLLCTKAGSSQTSSKPQNKIVIIEGPVRAEEDSITLNIYPYRYERFDPWIIKEIKQPVKNGYIRWEINTKVPVALINGLFSYNLAYLTEPGDSIYIHHNNGKIEFSGKGSEMFCLSKMVENFLNKIKDKPEEGLSDGDREPASSLKDYLAWNSYLNKETANWRNLLNNNKNKISRLAYLNLKDLVLRHIEKIRMHKFHSIRRSSIVGQVNQYGLTNEDLCNIYDTTMVNPSSKWLRYERDYIYNPDYAWDVLKDEIYRTKRKFFRTKDSDTTILGQNPINMYLTGYFGKSGHLFRF